MTGDINILVDKIASAVSNASLAALIKLLPEIKEESQVNEIEVALSAMREKVPSVMEGLMGEIFNTQTDPSFAISKAAMKIAEEGVSAVKAFRERQPFFCSPNEDAPPREPGL